MVAEVRGFKAGRLACLALACAGAAMGATGQSAGGALRLEPPADTHALKAATDAAAAGAGGGHALSNPTVFASQSFRLLDHNTQVATLVSGRGTLPAASPDADSVNACFVSLVREAAQPAIVVTIGTGEWETEACGAVSAVGLLPDAGPQHRVAIVYKASAAHTTALEPVVLGWSGNAGLAIDLEASRRASLAGATTLAAVRAAAR